MGCAGSKPEVPLAQLNSYGQGHVPQAVSQGSGPPELSRQTTGGSLKWNERAAQNSGVGMAFEFLDEHSLWRNIPDKDVIDQLGKLVSGKAEEAAYSSALNGQKYRTTLGADGMLAQVNVGTGVMRPVRISPFFFEFEEHVRKWSPVKEPPALVSLTGALLSSKVTKYTSSNKEGGRFEYQAQLVSDNGLCLQRNTVTGKLRRIRVSPMGLDGENCASAAMPSLPVTCQPCLLTQRSPDRDRAPQTLNSRKMAGSGSL